MGSSTQGLSRKTGIRGTPFVKGNKAHPKAGRPKGSKTKRDIILEGAVSASTLTGLMPLEFLLDVMRDHNRGLNIRVECAKIAAPYVHKRMPLAVETTNVPFKVFDLDALDDLSDDELEMVHRIMLKAAEKAEREARTIDYERPVIGEQTNLVVRPDIRILQPPPSPRRDDGAEDAVFVPRAALLSRLDPTKKPWEV